MIGESVNLGWWGIKVCGVFVQLSSALSARTADEKFTSTGIVVADGITTAD